MAGNKNSGRKTVFDQDIADEVCARLSEGESLRSICRDDNMPAESTVRAWALDDVNNFYAQYTRARQLMAERLADDIIDLCDMPPEKTQSGSVDSGDVAHKRLMVDTRKWMVSKMLPKVYGDKVQVGGDPDGAPIKYEKVIREVIDAKH